MVVVYVWYVMMVAMAIVAVVCYHDAATIHINALGLQTRSQVLFLLMYATAP